MRLKVDDFVYVLRNESYLLKKDLGMLTKYNLFKKGMKFSQPNNLRGLSVNSPWRQHDKTDIISPHKKLHQQIQLLLQ